MNRMKLLAVTALLLLAPSTALADYKFGGWGNGRGPRWADSRSCDRNPRWNQGHYNNGYYNNSWDGYRNSGFGLNQYSDQIRYGVRSGQLSNREVRELEERRRQIQLDAAAYRADGRLSNRERNELREDIRDYREKLNHELNDGERRRIRY